MQQNLQQTNRANMGLRVTRKSVIQLQRHDATVEGFKALRRAALTTLISLVIGGVSVTTAFQLKLNHTIHYPG